MKVDEQFKCKDCDNYNQCKYYHNRRETSFICKEFQNQWGFIEELEKIKIDFEELANDEWNIQVGASKGLGCAIDVVEDRISELKGE